MKETSSHLFFWGTNFSQWAKSPFTENSITFNTAEKYMMYHKAMLFGDTEIAEKILKATDPKVQKHLGRQVKGFDASKWDEKKFDIVVQGTYLKFSQNLKMKEELLATGDKTIVEASPTDFIWGVGLHWNDPDVLDESKWRGENLLGKALMVVRNKLKA